jgi:hypothetical protein
MALSKSFYYPESDVIEFGGQQFEMHMAMEFTGLTREELTRNAIVVSSSYDDAIGTIINSK